MKKCVTLFTCFVLLRNVGGGTASSSKGRQPPPKGKIWHPFHTRKKRLTDVPCRCQVWTWNRVCCDIRGGNDDVPPPPPPPTMNEEEEEVVDVNVSLSQDEYKRDVVSQKNVGLSDDNGVVSSEWGLPPPPLPSLSSISSQTLEVNNEIGSMSGNTAEVDASHFVEQQVMSDADSRGVDIPPPPPPSLSSISVSSQTLEVNNASGNAVGADTSNFAEQQVMSDADSRDMDIPPPPPPSLSSISSQTLEVNNEIRSASGNAAGADTSNFAEEQVMSDADSRDVKVPPPPPPSLSSISSQTLEVNNEIRSMSGNAVEVDKSNFAEQQVISDVYSGDLDIPPPSTPCQPLEVENDMGIAGSNAVEVDKKPFEEQNIFGEDEDSLEMSLPPPPPPLPSKLSRPLGNENESERDSDASQMGLPLPPPFLPSHSQKLDDVQSQNNLNSDSIDDGTVDISTERACEEEIEKKSPILEENDSQNIVPDFIAESQSFDANLLIEDDEKCIEKKVKRNDEDSRKYEIPPPPPPSPPQGLLHNLDLQGNIINACDKESKQSSAVDDVESSDKYLSPPPPPFSSFHDGNHVRDISPSSPPQSVEEESGASSKSNPVQEINVMHQHDDATTDVTSSNENGNESGYTKESEIVGNQSISSSFVSDPVPELSNEIIKQSNVKLCERCPLRRDCSASIQSSQDSHQVETEKNIEEALPYLSSLANIDRDLDEDEFDRLIMEITGDESLDEIKPFENEYLNDENVEGNAEEVKGIEENSNSVIFDSLSSSEVEEVSDGSNFESDYVADKGNEVESDDIARSEINIDTNEISDDESFSYEVESGLDEDIDAFTDQPYPEVLSKDVEGELDRVSIDDLSYSEIFSDEEVSSDLDADEILALDEATLTLDTNSYDENYDFDKSGDNFLLEEDSSYDSLNEYDLQVLEHSSLLLNNDASDCDDDSLLQYDYEGDDTYSDMESEYELDIEKESTSESEELEERIILDLGDSAVDNNVESDELDEHWAAHHGVPSRKQQLFEEEQRKLFEEQARVHAAMAQHQQQTGHGSIGWNIQPPPPPPNSSQSSAHLGISRSSLHIRTGESGTTIVRRQHFNINIPASSAMDAEEIVGDDKHNDVDKMNESENLHQTTNQGDPYLQRPQYFEGQNYQSQEHFGDANEQRNQQPPPPPPQP